MKEIGNKFTKENSRKRKVFSQSSTVFIKEFHSGLSHLLYDFKYIFTHKSTSISFLTNEKILSEFLDFVLNLQGCLEIAKSMDTDSQDWVYSYYDEVILYDAVNQMMSHLKTTSLKKEDIQMIIKTFESSLTKFFDHEDIQYKQVENFKIIDFKNVQGPITFRIPLQRFLSLFLLNLLTHHNIQPKDVLSNDEKFIGLLLEYPLRLFVLRSHIKRLFWQRNNNQIQEQFINYFFTDNQLCLDMFLVQICSTIMNLDQFYLTCIDRFRTDKDLFIMDSKMNVDYQLEDDFFRFILTTNNDRILTGKDQGESIKNVILHQLFMNNLKFSDLKKSIPKLLKKENIDQIIKDVSEFQQGKKSQEATYSVKDQYWSQFDIYYPLYHEQSLQKAEDRFRSKFKKEMPVKIPSVSILNDFKNLLNNEILHRIIFLVLYRSLKDKASSELLNIALHSILLLLESEKDKKEEKNESFENKEVKSYLDFSFPSNLFISNSKYQILGLSMIDLLNSLKTKKETHKEQIYYIGEVLNKLAQFGIQVKEKIEEDEVDPEEERRKKLARAKERQKKMEEEHNKKMKELENAFSFEDDDTDELKDEKLCVLCHSGTSPKGIQSFCLINQLSKSGSVMTANKLNFLELKGETKGIHHNEKIEIKPKIGENDELFSNIDNSFGIQMNTCHHIVHHDCFDSYFTSLTQRDSFKGSWCANLEKFEYLCPVCGRLGNSLCPIIDESLNDLFTKYCNVKEETEKKKMKIDNSLLYYSEILSKIETSNEKKSEKFKDFSTLFSIEHLLERCNFIKNHTLQNDKNRPDFIYSMISYNIASQELVMRDSTLVELPNTRELKYMIRLIHELLETDNYKIIRNQHLSTLLRSLLGNQNSSILSSDSNGILPFLSCDLFSMFVRFCLTRPETFKQEEYFLLLNLFYFAQVIQSFIVLKFYYKPESKLMDLKISCLEKLNLEKSVSMDDMKLLTDLTLPFLRRITLFTQLCYDKRFEKNEKTEFDSILSFLKLPSISKVISSIKDKDSQEFIFTNQWLLQFDITWKQNIDNLSYHQIIIPRISAPNPIKYIKLPHKYQPLILEFNSRKCKDCGDNVETAICLLCGEITNIERCKCINPNTNKRYEVGGCTRHGLLTGHHLFLVIKNNQILLLRDGRLTFLPSPYFDENGERDPMLKRGKPLTLDEFRYQENIHDYILSRFDQDTIILNDTLYKQSFRF